MNTSAPFPAVRLLAAGFLTLLLVIWVGFQKGALLPDIRLLQRGEFGSLGRLIVTANLAVFILLILFPVGWRGPRGSRSLALLLAVFPLLTLLLTAAWPAGWIAYHWLASKF